MIQAQLLLEPTTNKVICDEVKISPEALELYQKNISERVEKKVLILSNDREQELKKIAPLKELLSIDKSDKLFDQKLQDVGQKVNLAEEQIVTLKSSFGIQIKHDSGFQF
jgi:predicted HAD superfamily phosphohydrolase YqeG